MNLEGGYKPKMNRCEVCDSAFMDDSYLSLHYICNHEEEFET